MNGNHYIVVIWRVVVVCILLAISFNSMIIEICEDKFWISHGLR